MSLSAKDIIRISTSIVPVGMLRAEIGRTLLFTTDTSVDHRVKVYSSLDEVASDYPEGSEPYAGAQVYFSQSPYPKNLLIGVWDQSEVVQQVPFELIGEPLTHQDEMDMLVDGIGVEIKITYSNGDTSSMHDVPIGDGLLDLSGYSSVQEALPSINDWFEKAGFSNSGNTRAIVQVSFDSVTRQFKFKVAAENTITAGVYVTDVEFRSYEEESDFGVKSKMNEHYGTVTKVTGSSEGYVTASQALDRIALDNPAFTFVCEARNLSDTDAVVDIAQWCHTNQNYIACCASTDVETLSEDEGTIFYQLYQDMNPNAFGTWGFVNDYKHLSIAGRLSSVNFSSANSLITPFMKVLPTCETDNLSSNDASILKKQRVNFYSTRSSVPMYEEGFTFSPDYWVDMKYWLIWFEDACRVALFNVLYQSGKVPQTDEGTSLLQMALEKVCRQGVHNGGIAGGFVSEAMAFDIRQTTGNKGFDGFLQDGFLVYIEPVAEQDQTERVQRKAPPVHVWLKGSGAIHSVDVSIVFEQ